MAKSNVEIGVELEDKATPGIRNIESSIIRLVGAISAAGVVIGTLALPISMSAEFQKEMLNVKKTTDYGTEAIGSLGDSLLGLSRTINVSAVELAKIAELGGQLGVGARGGEALLAFTEEIARAVTALDVTAEEAATSLGKLINIFNIPPEKYRNTLAAINEISNVSTAKPSELFDILRRIGNLGGSISLPQATALSAVMIDLGLTAETAGTSLTKVFADMKAQAGEFANFMGVSTASWTKLVADNGVQALSMYLERLNQMPPAIAAATKVQLTGGGRIFELITKLQAEQAKLGGGLTASLYNQADAAYEKGTSAIKEQLSVLSGLSAQWQVFKNNVAATFIKAGEESLQPLTLALTELSAATNNPQFAAGLSSALSGVIALVSTLATGIAAIASLKINWAPILGVGAILVASALLNKLALGYGNLITRVNASIASTGAAAAATRPLASSYGLLASAMNLPVVAAEKLALAVKVASASQAQALKAKELSDFTAREAGLQHTLQVERQKRASAAREKADLYLAAKVTPLQRIKDSGGTLTATQNRSLAASAAHYRKLEAMAVSHEALVNTTAKQAHLAAGATTDAFYRKQLLQYANYLRNREQLAMASAQAEQNTLAAGAGVRTAGAGVTGLVNAVRERGIMASVGQGLLALTGQTAAWGLATTNAQRAAVIGWGVVAGAVRGVTFAMSGLLALASRLLTGLLWVGLIAAALEFMGVLDKVKEKIVEVIKSLGFKVPEFLQTEKMKEAVDAQKTMYRDLIAASADFNAKFGEVIIRAKLSVDGKEEFNATLDNTKKKLDEVIAKASKKVEFSLGASGDASAGLTETIDLYGTAAKKVAALAAQLQKAKGDQEQLKIEQKAAADAYAAIEYKDKIGAVSLKTKAALDALTASSKLLGASLALDEAGKLQTQLDTATEAMEKFAGVALKGLGVAQVNLLFKDVSIDSRTFVAGLQQDKIQLEAYLKEVEGFSQQASAALRNGDVVDPDTVPKTNAAKAAVADLTTKITDLTAKMKENRAAVLASPDLRKIFATEGSADAFINSLEKAPQTLSDTISKLITVGGSLANVAQGASIVNLGLGKTKEELAATAVVAAALGSSMKINASIATAAANDAANAVGRAIEKTKQSVKEMESQAALIQRSLAKGAQGAISQKAAETIDKNGASREAALSRALSIETAILNTIEKEGAISAKDIQDRLDGLEEARKAAEDELARKANAGQITTAQYIQGVKDINQRISGEKEILRMYEGRGDLTKGQVAGLLMVQDIVKETASKKIIDDTSIKKAELAINDVQVAIQKATKDGFLFNEQAKENARILNDPNASSDEKAKALEEQVKQTINLRVQSKYLLEDQEKLVSLQRAGGKELITNESIQRVGILAEAFTSAANLLDTSAASSAQATLTKQGTNLNELAQHFDRMAAAAGQDLKTKLKGSVEEMEKLLVYATKLEAVVKLTNESKSTVGNFANIKVGPEEQAKITAGLVAAISEAAKTPIPVKFAAPTKEEIEAVRAGLIGVLGEGLFTPSVKKLETTTIKVPVELVVTNPQVLKGSTSIAGKADGGPIYGAGTGRSDSIPIMASHGEYMMDAQTVRMFGPGFFSMIQKLAKSSGGPSRLTKFGIQGFANGGLISSPMGQLGSLMSGGLMSAVGGGSESPTGRDIVDVTLRVGGEKLSLFAERQQASNLVTSLRKMEVGA